MNDSDETIVVLLPGLWMPAWVMVFLQRRLARAGFRCVRFGYASHRATLEENAKRLVAFVHGLSCARVHLVGHSLGGVLALHATAAHRLAAVRRVVLMGSPYRDSFAARKLSCLALGRCVLGKTIPGWLAAEKPPAPPGVEVGVIAGTLEAGFGMLVVPQLPRPHDGVICVEETPVPGMAADAQVHVSHAGMLVSRGIGELVARFLAQGRFQPAPPAELPADKELAYRASRDP